MKVFLDNNLVDKILFHVNDGMNYGRFFGGETKDYTIILSKTKFKELIEKEYIEVRDEIKLDDEFNKDTSDFTNTNYCSLDELFNHPVDFYEVMRTYLHITLLLKIVDISIEDPSWKYVINSTDEIYVLGDDVYIKGRVFERISGT